MLLLDFMFLGAVGKKLCADNVGDMMASRRMAPTILSSSYLTGVVIFLNGSAPSDRMHNLQYGALFDLFCYATFELTNMVLLNGAIVAPDIVWGAVLTAVSAAVGGLIAGWILAKIQSISVSTSYLMS